MIKIIDRGLADYNTVLREQQDVFEHLIAAQKQKLEITEEIIAVEHPHIYTMGVHADIGNLLVDKNWLEQNGIECIKIRRGGDITYHGPGQLVVYPIISLQKHHLGVKDYVTLLEQAVINTILKYGINGERIDGATGVWIGKNTPNERKICAIGIRCSHFVTMHGLALNVNTDLSYFSKINPCGFIDKPVTSIEREVGRKVDFEEVKSILCTELINLLS